MHILSAHNRSEFLATPQLVRFDYVDETDDLVPNLLIKADALVLKYIMLGARLQLLFALVHGDRLICALIVHDDPTSPCVLWSVLERESERQALLSLAAGKPLKVFLFNELAINVAWAEVSVNFTGNNLGTLAAYAGIGSFDHSNMGGTIETIFTQSRDREARNSTSLHVDLPNGSSWAPVRNVMITNDVTASEIDFFDNDEGRQQEKLVIWLTDNFHPTAVIDQPQIMKGGRLRELTDILLSYSGGAFIFESKALSILNRSELPDRAKLRKNVLANVEKAVKQLKGASRQIKANTKIYDGHGKEHEVERTHPIHAIVLIPDLELLPRPFGYEMMVEFMKENRSYLHILDPSELLRIVQVTEEFVRRSESQTITPMMAFDSRLIERAETCAKAKSLNVEIITRFEQNS